VLVLSMVIGGDGEECLVSRMDQGEKNRDKEKPLSFRSRTLPVQQAPVRKVEALLLGDGGGL